MTETSTTAPIDPPDPSESAGCCAPQTQATCCDPQEKRNCCGPAATAAGGCGCAAGVNATEVRELVRERYAAAARATAGRAETAGCCDPAPVRTTDAHGHAVFGASLYAGAEADAPAAAVAASLGCGVPTAVAALREGETVLDLGSGGGADVLICARRVGATGRAIGLDMTDEMLALARRNAAEAGVTNVEFRKGYIERIPLEDASVDVVISNCVLNLSADKPAVLREAARVLRAGGRLAISDVIADEDMDDATRADMRQWTGCVAGALTRSQLERALADAGFADVEIRETHRVHPHAAAAIVRGVKPAAQRRRRPRAPYAR